jgi:hypothetical protein
MPDLEVPVLGKEVGAPKAARLAGHPLGVIPD